jgi:SAM-dependent methyltransferase
MGVLLLCLPAMVGGNMPLNWLDVTPLSFNVLLLLERVQLGLLPGWVDERELGIALRANPVVEWYMRHKHPELSGWLEGVLGQAGPASAERVREAELAVLRQIVDLVVYAVDPAVYDAQPFLGWDSRELTSPVDFTGKRVIDVGAGTGRLALVAAAGAESVFAVEPVGNLRRYLKDKARGLGITNVYPVDGLITDIPFPDGFADVTMGGHVFGGDPPAEYAEMRRVTASGGMIILCPGNNDVDDAVHAFLVAQGFDWSRFEEPGDGVKRKYWKRV